MQGVVHPVTAISGLALLACPLFNWLLIFKLRMGLDGAVAALVATWLYMLAMLAGFLIWHERRRHGTPQQTWHGWWVGGQAGRPGAGLIGHSMLGWHYCLRVAAACPLQVANHVPARMRLASLHCLPACTTPSLHCRTSESFKGLGAYYRLAVPSTLMVCLEWWACEYFLPPALRRSGSPVVPLACNGVLLVVGLLLPPHHRFRPAEPACLPALSLNYPHLHATLCR